jgi:hypothetical protein
VSNYSHAEQLQRTVPPVQQLGYLVSQLGEWAKVNQGLLPLYTEFSRLHKEMAGTEPSTQADEYWYLVNGDSADQLTTAGYRKEYDGRVLHEALTAFMKALVAGDEYVTIEALKDKGYQRGTPQT